MLARLRAVPDTFVGLLKGPPSGPGVSDVHESVQVNAVIVGKPAVSG